MTDKSGYSVEYIIKRSTNKSIYPLIKFLETISDVVCIDLENYYKIKIHVTTKHPDKIIEEGLLFGELINIKILNLEFKEN
jgi:dihydroxyacetone kinase-like predicted kinase